MRRILFIAILFMSQMSFGQHFSVAEITSTSHNTDLGFQVYPNPVNGNFFNVNFDFTAQQFPAAKLSITNVLGQLIYTHKLDKTDYINKSIRIDLADFQLEKGVYFIKISSGEESRLQKIAIR